MENISENLLSRHYLAKDRYDSKEYLIDQKTYTHIIDLVHFYHESIYMLPDDEVVHVQKLEGPEHTSPCDIPVNHIVFNLH